MSTAETVSFDLNEILNSVRKCTKYPFGGIGAKNKYITCADGYSISIQCCKYTYCAPRETYELVDKYTQFELGYPNELDSLIDGYVEKPGNIETVFPYVPREIVSELIKKHGGVYIELQEAMALLR